MEPSVPGEIHEADQSLALVGADIDQAAFEDGAEATRVVPLPADLEQGVQLRIAYLGTEPVSNISSHSMHILRPQGRRALVRNKATDLQARRAALLSGPGSPATSLPG